MKKNRFNAVLYMYFEMQKDAHLVSDGFLHCYLIFNRLYCVCIWVGGGGLRIGVVGWLFVLKLAK